MKLHFNILPYQNIAVQSVTHLFQGESAVAQKYLKKSDELFGDSVVNQLPLSWDKVQINLHEVQKLNKLSLTNEIDQKQFCITMETGTGKTYVYTKTIYELHQQYGLSKFIIVVPSVAIREGVQKSLEVTHEHFQNIYGKKSIRWFIYNSARLADVREFARNNGIEIMIINIDAFRKSENIINQPMDRMNGNRPIDLIAQTQPVVIIDEPQSVVNTAKAKEALKWLNPLFVLRYSATHREEINNIYSLTPVDAYQQGLVKQISVSSITAQGNFNQPYLRLLSVDNTNGFRAKIELDIKNASGKITRVTKTVRNGEDLFILSNEREVYKDWRISDIDCLAGYENIEINGSFTIALGQAIGNVDEKDIRRGQIHKTIEHHLNKELQLLPRGIKVLSLFFIDKVSHYRVYGEKSIEKGEYARIFEEEYKSLIQLPQYAPLKTLLPQLEDAECAHDGYFSMDKKGKMKDTRGDTVDDQSTYALIMKDKEKLLSIQTPLRFIFSHSALREGWDNPNVFQVCTLLDQSSALSARQRIGRGLRLCVNQNGERISDKELNLLHIIATENFIEFADKLQKEIEQETGIKFGAIDISTFINIDVPISTAQQLGIEISEEKQQEYEAWQNEEKQRAVTVDENAPEAPAPSTSLDMGADKFVSPSFQPRLKSEPTTKLGHEQAAKLLEALVKQNVIDKKGKLTKVAHEKICSDSLSDVLPPAYQPIANPIISEMRKADTRLPIRDASKEIVVRRKKEILESPEFLAIWERISQKTHYRVKMDKERFIEAAKHKLVFMPPIEKAKIEEITTYLDIKKEGVQTQLESMRSVEMKHVLTNIPDILWILKNELKLTKATLFEIIKRAERVGDLLNNPEKFIEQIYDLLKDTKAEMLSDGVRYIHIHGQSYSAQEVFDKEEILAYLDNSILSTRSVYDHILVDSVIESNFAQDLEKDPDVKFFFKLPRKFKIDTPFGSYNPDWAVLLNEYGTDKLYLVIESKGTLQEVQRRVMENAKIHCARQHFKALENVDYKDAVTWYDAKPAA
ncbi:restriction endonuclease [Bartonella sp. B17]